MKSKYFTFLSFIPALAYWYLEARYELKVAVIGGMSLSILEIVVEKIFTKHVHSFTKVNFFLIMGLGSLSLFAQEGAWFKMQPTLSSVATFFVFWLKMRKGESYLEEMMSGASSKVTIPHAVIKGMEKHFSYFLLFYGLGMAILALKAPTSWWLFGKTGGFYLTFGTFMAIEFFLMRRQMQQSFSMPKQISEEISDDLFEQSEWLVLSINFHHFHQQHKNTLLEVFSKQKKIMVGVGFEEGAQSPLEWKERSYQLRNRDEAIFISQHLIHSTLKNLSTRFQSLTLSPLSSKEVPADEEKALQWLKVSLRTLKEAINQHPAQLQALIFGGVNPEDQRKMLRVICFNLDLFVIFHEDGRMQLTVFDDKDKGQGTSPRPSLQMLFGRLRPQVLDEFILLMTAIGRVGTDV